MLKSFKHNISIAMLCFCVACGADRDATEQKSNEEKSSAAVNRQDSDFTDVRQNEMLENIWLNSIKTFKTDSVTRTELPAKISLKGRLVEARKWEDSNGENILVLIMGGPFIEYETADYVAFRYAELRRKQYIKKAGAYHMIWDIYDYVNTCELDITLGFVPNAVTVTDLDKDGTTETTIVYRLSCRSDVSPSDMKVRLRGIHVYRTVGYRVERVRRSIVT